MSERTASGLKDLAYNLAFLGVLVLAVGVIAFAVYWNNSAARLDDVVKEAKRPPNPAQSTGFSGEVKQDFVKEDGSPRLNASGR